MAHVTLLPKTHILYFSISTFQSTSACPIRLFSVAPCYHVFPVQPFMNEFDMVPVAPNIIGITFVCTFHTGCIYIVRFLYWHLSWSHFCHLKLKCPWTDRHVPSALPCIMMPGLLQQPSTLPAAHSHTVTLSHSQSHCHTVTQSHCHTVTLSLSHCHTVTLSHCHTVTPSHSHTVTQSHRHTVTPSHSHTVTVTQSHCHTVTLSHSHTVTQSHCHTVTLSHCHTVTQSHS